MDKLLCTLGVGFLFCIVKMRAGLESLTGFIKGDDGFLLMVGVCGIGLFGVGVVLRKIIEPEPGYEELGHPTIQRLQMKEPADKLIVSGAASVEAIEMATEEYNFRYLDTGSRKS